MQELNVFNILSLIDVIGEDKVVAVLSGFSCPINEEIEHFVKNDAIEFAKKKMSITHLVMNENEDLVAILALTHKAITMDEHVLSKTAAAKIKRYARLVDGSYTVSAFLVAQLGKNYALDKDDLPEGADLIEAAMGILKRVQKEIGGGVVYLDCEKKESLLSFYKKNGFRIFGERQGDVHAPEYIQMYRFF